MQACCAACSCLASIPQNARLSAALEWAASSCSGTKSNWRQVCLWHTRGSSTSRRQLWAGALCCDKAQRHRCSGRTCKAGGMQWPVEQARRPGCSSHSCRLSLLLQMKGLRKEVAELMRQNKQGNARIRCGAPLAMRCRGARAANDFTWKKKCTPSLLTCCCTCVPWVHPSRCQSRPRLGPWCAGWKL